MPKEGKTQEEMLGQMLRTLQQNNTSHKQGLKRTKGDQNMKH